MENDNQRDVFDEMMRKSSKRITAETRINWETKISKEEKAQPADNSTEITKTETNE